MVIEQLRTRQVGRYSPAPVSDAAIAQLLQIARWSGSWANSQPWHFIVVRDHDLLRRISQLRPMMGWLADAPLAIAIVLDTAGTSQAYDQGRGTERLLIGAPIIRLRGGGTRFGGRRKGTQGKRDPGIPPAPDPRSGGRGAP